MILNIMMVICIKQHLSKIWISINEKPKQQRSWVEKRALLRKRSVYISFPTILDVINSNKV